MRDERINRLTAEAIGVFYDVYNELGFGFLETVYQRAMHIALRERGVPHVKQAPVPVWYHGERLGVFYADFMVAGAVIVELKACRVLDPSAEAQVLNYLRATDVEVGLLLNFGERPQIKRLVFDNDRKKSHR